MNDSRLYEVIKVSWLNQACHYCKCVPLINIDDVRLRRSATQQGTTTARLNGIVSAHGWMSHLRYSGTHDEMWKLLSPLFKCLLTSSQIIKPLMYILESFTKPAIRNSHSFPGLIGLSYPGLVFLTEGLSVSGIVRAVQIIITQHFSWVKWRGWGRLMGSHQ